MGRFAVIGGTSLLLVLSMVSSSEAAGSVDTGLEFVAPEQIALTGSSEESDGVSVWLANNSGRELTPSFDVSLEDGDGNSIPGNQVKVVTVDDEDAEVAVGSLPADSVDRYRLMLKGPSADDTASGQLVAKAAGVAPGTVALSVGPETVANRGVTEALLAPLIVAVVLMFFVWLISVKPVSLSDPLGTLDLDFKASFATTLTTVGAVLGTIIAAGVLPEQTVNLSKDAFSALNLLYLVAIVTAGVVYLAWQKSVWEVKTADNTKEVRKQQGYVGLFLAASLITVWAVFGELWVTWLLVDELGRGEGFSSLTVCLFKVLIVVAALATVFYTFWRVHSIVKSERPVTAAGAAAAPAVPEPTRKVTLL
jgi:hypothetical protein